MIPIYLHLYHNNINFFLTSGPPAIPKRESAEYNSNRNYKKVTTTTILIKKRIGIGYKNYKKQCPGLEFRLTISCSTRNDQNQ